MFRIFADDTLIYDNTFDDYKINSGSLSFETNKSGSFTFSLYNDHFFYDKFVLLKTLITVYKRDEIIFRGRVLNEDIDYFNNKTLTCEGELGFFNDSIIRPYDFSGSPRDLLKKYVDDHNSQVDEFKRFTLGDVKTTSNSIAANNQDYASSFENLEKQLLEPHGGHLYFTHDEDGNPTIHYTSDFEKTATQTIEFGANLKSYAKKVESTDLATAIIPLGAKVDDNNSDTDDPPLTIAGVNGGVDYVYNQTAVNLYGWIFKVQKFDDIEDANKLKTTALETLDDLVNKNITIDLTAVDLNLLDKNIESFSVGDRIRVISKPHNFDEVLVCNKLDLDLLNAGNSSLSLGHTFKSFVETNTKILNTANAINVIQSSVNKFTNKVISLGSKVEDNKNNVDTTLNNYNQIASDLGLINENILVLVEKIANLETKATSHEELILLLNERVTNLEKNGGTK